MNRDSSSKRFRPLLVAFVSLILVFGGNVYADTTFVDSFDVSGQETNPRGMTFSSNGLKMFVVGFSGIDVNEYDLGTAFDVSTAVFVDSFDVSGQETDPRGMAFSSNGLKMFVVGTVGDDVNEYDLGTAFDVSTAVFVDSFDVSGQETIPTGMAFSSNGLKMFVVGSDDDDVNEYDLGTAFDVSTAVFVDSFDVSGQETFPQDVAFSSNGLKMFVVGVSGGGDVNEYTLEVAFDLFSSPSSENDGGGGCSGDCEEPTLGMDSKGTRLVDNGFTYNGKSIDVERFFTPYPLVTVRTGVTNVAEFKIYDNLGPDNISHFELAFGLAKGEILSNSKAVINWDKSFDGVEETSVNDPEHVLDDITITTSEGNCSEESKQQCLLVKVVHTFRAPLDFNILGTNVWDAKRNAWQNYYNHGIEVVGESLNPPKQHDGINKGHIYHLTETGKTSAVDEFGNSWTLEYGQWDMDYIPNKKIVDDIPMGGIAREHAYFDMYKYEQYLLAYYELEQICPECLDEPYEEIDNIFSYDFKDRVSKLDNPEIQSKMNMASQKAQGIMDYILDSTLHLNQ